MSQSDTNAATQHLETMSQEGEQAWWNLLGVLYRWRRFIIGVTSVMAVASVIISLLLPNWFKASSRLLLPASASGVLQALSWATSPPPRSPCWVGAVATTCATWPS